MKCPKCGYNSFDYLDSCKKCGQGLVDHKIKFNLSGFYSPGQPTAAVVNENNEEPEQSEDESVDFGFDFLDEKEDPIEKTSSDISLGDDRLDVNIDQPFGADSETIPAEAPESASENDSDDKPGKGPEFAF